MSRLEKKCFIGAAGFHLLLLAILVVGPAFFVADKIDDSDVITFIPMKLTDEKVSGGGSPSATPPTPAQPPAPTPPTPRIDNPPPTPPPERRVEKVETPKVETPKINKPDPEVVEPKPEKKPRQVQVSDKVVKLKPPTKPANDSKPNAQTAADTERLRQVASTLKNIRGNLSATAKVEVPNDGPGGGGPSYANYAQEVRRVYTEAVRIPPEVNDDSAVVKVRVTIARNGNVISSSMVTPSGSPEVDRAIQATLDRVTFVAPFPEGAKDSQRTFVISFDLKAKKSFG